MIGIIDYGMGNLGSMRHACEFLGVQARILPTPDRFQDCQALILPGVGAFGDCMDHLQAHGFVAAIREWIDRGRPFLGVCVGLQVLFEGSEESPEVDGLGVFPGVVKRFVGRGAWKIPQIGWNRVKQRQSDCPLFKEIPDESYFYFVHSYCVQASSQDWVAGTTDYTLEYGSVIWKDQVMALQFHPEKSQKMGLALLRNFETWCARLEHA